jgi:O-antigen ligase
MSRQEYFREIHFTRGLFYAFLLLLFWLPIPIGSDRPWFWGLAASLAGLLLLVWVIAWGLSLVHVPHKMRDVRWPLGLLLAFTAWIGFQALSVVWTMESGASGFPDQSAALLSVDPQATLESLLRSLGLIIMGVLALLLVRSRRRVQLVLWVMVVAGTLQAVYGSLTMLSGVEYDIFTAKSYAKGVATGTYINRNHYANLMVLCLAAGIGLLICRMDFAGEKSWRERVRGILRALLGPKARLRIYLAIMVVALVLTRSRMGNTSFFIGLLLVGLIALVRMKKANRPLVILIISLIAVDIFLIGTWFGVEQVIDRVQKTVVLENDEWQIQTSDQDRLNADREALAIIRLSPLTGTGGGSFYTVFPAWRAADQRFFDHVHNDYLEFATDYGIPATLLLAAFLFLAIKKSFQRLGKPDDVVGFGAAFASLLAIVAVGLHATVEFNLQIYANAVYFTILCLLPFCMHEHRRKKRAL